MHKKLKINAGKKQESILFNTFMFVVQEKKRKKKNKTFIF